MSSIELLDRTRKINKLLHNNNKSKVVFNDICSIMQDILESNVLVISKKGKVLGLGHFDGTDDITELLVDKINQKKKQSKHFNLAISGGNTPNILFAMLAGEFAEKVDWDALRLFWVDERCVEPTDSESNFGNVYKILLKNVMKKCQKVLIQHLYFVMD